MITKQANLLSLLSDPRGAHIAFKLNQDRDEAIMVEVAVPGERWEIEFLDDGSVEAEVFRSDGTIYDVSVLDHLLDKHQS